MEQHSKPHVDKKALELLKKKKLQQLKMQEIVKKQKSKKHEDTDS